MKTKKVEKDGAKLNLDSRLMIIKYIFLAALAASIGLSYPLWVTEARYFPLTPLFDFLPELSNPFDLIVFFITILVLVIAFIYPFNFLLNLSLLCLLLILAILDLNRLQPWFFHYLLILFVFCTIRNQKKAHAIPSLQLIFCALYFWSGIHKFNTYYYSDVVPWFTQSVGGGLFFQFIAFLVPFIEVFIAIGLLFRKFRVPALFLATIIHVYSLFVIGPLGYNINEVIWPWNIAMIALIWLVFPKKEYHYENLVQIWKMPSVSVLMLFAVILPFFHILNLWPANLSFNLYSGNTNNGIVFIGEDVKEMLPEVVSNLVHDNKIYVKEWAMKELNVPGWIERSNYINARNFIYDFANDTNEVVLLYQPKTTVFGTPLSEFPD